NITEAVQNCAHAKEKKKDSVPQKAEGLQHTPAQIQSLLEANKLSEKPNNSYTGQGALTPGYVQESSPWVFQGTPDGIPLYRQHNGEHSMNVKVAREHNNLVVMISAVAFATLTGLLLLGASVFLSVFASLAATSLVIYLRVSRLETKDGTVPNYMTHQAMMAGTERVVSTLIDGNVFGFQTGGCEIEKINEYASVMRYDLLPVWCGLGYSEPRDIVVMRYWRKEEDGSFVILFQSTTSAKAPPRPEFIRASVPVSAVVVYPVKPELRSQKNPRCMVTMIIGYDPGSWGSIMVNYFHSTRYVLPLMKALRRLKDSVQAPDFIDPSITIEPQASTDSTAEIVPNIGVDNKGLVVGVKKYPTSCQPHTWAEPDGSQFSVRGPHYLKDKVKMTADTSVFHLVGVDLFSFEDPAERINLSSRSDSLVRKVEKEALENGTKVPFTFIVNMIIPCTDNIAFVCYYQPTHANWREENSEFKDLFSDFVDGDDAFRNSRFKLIPKIVDGSYLLRKVLGAKPAIIGNKGLTNPYFRGENWFEVDIDVNSDSHARNITGMVVGATKSLVVDIAFIIEAQAEEELPERVLGTVRLNHLDTTKSLRVPKGRGDVLPDDKNSPGSVTSGGLSLNGGARPSDTMSLHSANDGGKGSQQTPKGSTPSSAIAAPSPIGEHVKGKHQRTASATSLRNIMGKRAGRKSPEPLSPMFGHQGASLGAGGLAGAREESLTVPSQ
ncbi:hypothetical protein SARC_04767, partial [Sphaeroforma arctica JP610]